MTIPISPPDPQHSSSIVATLRADYQRFPQDQTYSLYAEDVFFQDPLNSFHGVDRYREMIHFIARWFRDPQLELHDTVQNDRQIRTQWTLSWICPFPWQPAVSISGYTEMDLNAAGLIQSHRDYWYCSRWNVLQQAIGLASPG